MEDKNVEGFEPEQPKLEESFEVGEETEVSEESEMPEEPEVLERPEVLRRAASAQAPAGELPVVGAPRKKRFALGGWIEKHTKRAVSHMYESRADEIEERARRAVGSAYRDQADDIQDRAIRAMRIAIAEESERIKEAIEHGVEIKKREVRLSLLVLVMASLVYLLLYWLTQSGEPTS